MINPTPEASLDNSARRRELMLKYTYLVFVGYAISQLLTWIAYQLGLSSVRKEEILFVTTATLGSTAAFAVVIKLRKEITNAFRNRIFFGQFGIWIFMYAQWILTLREVRVLALFGALLGLAFMLLKTRLYQSVVITAVVGAIQLIGSYYAINHLGQPGSLKLELFYTLCFLPTAFFVCVLADQYSKQRSAVREAKRVAEMRSAEFRAEADRVLVLNEELQTALDVIKEISIRDALTGLYNRRHLMVMLDIEKHRADRISTQFVILLVDIDHFKRINDSFGHLKGDEVLKRVGGLLQEALRASDLCARFGGEEFVVMLGATTPDEAASCADRIRSTIGSATMPEMPDDFRVTISLGLATYRRGEDVSATISRADQALYRAKGKGRNRLELAEEA